MTKQTITIYQTNDRQAQFEARMVGDTFWLAQSQMAELFDKDSDTIGLHLKKIFKDGGLGQNATTRFIAS